MWELICPAPQLLQLQLQSFSLSQQLLLPSPLGTHQYLQNDAPFGEQVCSSAFRIKKYFAKGREPYLITEVEDVNDLLRPKENCQVELQVPLVDTVDIQQVAQSVVGVLSEESA